jgi:hypothetical protein
MHKYRIGVVPDACNCDPMMFSELSDMREFTLDAVEKTSKGPAKSSISILLKRNIPTLILITVTFQTCSIYDS